MFRSINNSIFYLSFPDEGWLENDQQLELTIPDELDVNIQLRDWIFALEADVETTENALTRRERCWHSAFQCLSISAEGSRQDVSRQQNYVGPKHPVQKIIVSYASSLNSGENLQDPYMKIL